MNQIKGNISCREILRNYNQRCIASPQTKAYDLWLKSWPIPKERAMAIDEMTPIAQYMTREILDNSNGADVVRMRENNRFSANGCIADYQKLPWYRQLLQLGITPGQCIDIEANARLAALISWGLLVRQDGKWDHKPIIAKNFHPRVPNGQQHWHALDKTLYFYDVWSNIHYGFVGKAAGFSDSVLLDGAGLEQIGSNLGRWTAPQRDSTVNGLRAFDNPEDRAGIEMGISLFFNHRTTLTAQLLLRSIVGSNKFTKKPFNPPK